MLNDSALRSWSLKHSAGSPALLLNAKFHPVLLWLCGLFYCAFVIWMNCFQNCLHGLIFSSVTVYNDVFFFFDKHLWNNISAETGRVWWKWTILLYLRGHWNWNKFLHYPSLDYDKHFCNLLGWKRWKLNIKNCCNMPSWTLINTESLYFPGNLLKQEHFFLELVVFETETVKLPLINGKTSEDYRTVVSERTENICTIMIDLFHFDKDWNLCYLPGGFADMRTSAVQLHLDEQELRMKHFFGLPSQILMTYCFKISASVALNSLFAALLVFCYTLNTSAVPVVFDETIFDRWLLLLNILLW